MEQYEEYSEENSDNEVEVEHEEVVLGVVAPQPIHIRLEVVVPGVADKPELLSPSPPPSPGPESPQPPLRDAPSFMGFFTKDDLIDLEQ